MAWEPADIMTLILAHVIDIFAVARIQETPDKLLWLFDCRIDMHVL